MPSKKKKYNARFPPARIKKIMQTDDEVGKVAAAVPVIISRALELFVESLITKANEYTQQRNAKTLSTLHLKQCILAENKFDFLKELVDSIPDVQIDDDTSNSSLTSSLAISANSSNDLVKRIQPKTRQQRRRNSKKDPDDDAGPSNSTAEESESSEEEEDSQDENEEEEKADNANLHGQLKSGSNSTTFPTSSFHLTPTPFGNTDPDDEDYDS